MTIKVAYNYLLFILRLRKSLPAAIVSRVPLVECGEGLVEIPTTPRLLLRPADAGRVLRGRQGAVSRLLSVPDRLPTGYKLVVVDGFRSTALQTSRWHRRVRETAEEMPEATRPEIEMMAQRFTSRPTGTGSGHQAGAAFDLTLADAEGRLFDLGTNVKEASELTATNSRELNAEQRKHRKVLLTAMESAGFVNYPLEWWHFSFGDRMWAAYSRRREAFYGSDFLAAEVDEFIL